MDSMSAAWNKHPGPAASGSMTKVHGRTRLSTQSKPPLLTIRNRCDDVARTANGILSANSSFWSIYDDDDDQDKTQVREIMRDARRQVRSQKTAFLEKLTQTCGSLPVLEWESSGADSMRLHHPSGARNITELLSEASTIKNVLETASYGLLQVRKEFKARSLDGTCYKCNPVEFSQESGRAMRGLAQILTCWNDDVVGPLECIEGRCRRLLWG